METNRNRAQDQASLVDGAIAGLIATLPMTIVMLGLHQLEPFKEHNPLPPQKITRRAAQKSGVDKATSEDQIDLMTGVAHFGFGATAGSLYAPLANLSPLPAILSGLLYGLTVWFVSYQGWIPEANLMPPADKQSPQRNFLMIAAHLVYGSVLAGLVSWLAREK